MKTLHEMVMEMNGLAERDDFEMAHSLADDLMIEILEYLAENTIFKAPLNEIIKDYNSVGKWYA